MAQLDALERRFGRGCVLGGVAKIAATLTPDGVIKHLNDAQQLVYGELDGRKSPRVEALAAIMARASFASRPSDGILLEMWEKWVLLATLAGMNCLMRGQVGDNVATAEARKTAW